MGSLLMVGYEILTIFIPVLITFGILSVLYKKRKIRVEPSHFIGVLVFAVYIYGVFYFTGVGTIFDILRYGIEFRPEQINLLPFSDSSIFVTGYFLNVILFVPLGFLLPCLWPNYKNIFVPFVFGAFFSLLVEVSQLFNYRSTDVDDLILNTLGAVLGFLLYQVFARITNRLNRPAPYLRHEAALYLIIMFLGHFLTYDAYGLFRLINNF